MNAGQSLAADQCLEKRLSFEISGNFGELG
jgi:hypothetical protein